MSWISDNHRCTTCSGIYSIIVKRVDRDLPSTCPECLTKTGARTISAPNLMSTAMPDGTDRGDNYRKLKEAAKLERESMDLPESKRGEHNKAIRELKKL